MKYRQRLIIKLKELLELYKIKFLYPKTKYKDLQKLINQIFKLTSFLDDKHISFRRLSVRMSYVEQNLKSIPKCKQCGTNSISTSEAIFCSGKCQKKHFDLNEDPEKKAERIKKAVSSRNYDEIISKGNKTKKEDPNHSINYKINLDNSLSKICDNGLTVAQNRGITFSKNATPEFLKERADNSAFSRKLNGNNSSLNYWSSMSEEEKIRESNKRSKKGIETKIENGTIQPIEDRDAYDVYCQAASFKHGFKTNCEKQKALLKEYGVFNARNNKNTNGCGRDHLLSRRYGFDNNIATWIISHPANCEIVLNSENIRRANTNDNLITLEELLERIGNWAE